MDNSCSICCADYNKSGRLSITCECSGCEFTCCKSCIRTYLLGTTQNAHCMNCKKAWSQNFVIMQLNRSFYASGYKKHRAKLLLDREISKLPETMEAASRVEKIDKEKEIQTEITAKMNLLHAKLNGLEYEKRESYGRVYKIKGGQDEEKRQFIMACPNNDCRGYLSTQYKCDLCKLHTCSKCLEIIGYNKTDEHTCVEDNIKSAELIKKETRPCPTCGTRIYKLEGCDQMWCTECHKAFNWRTGKIDVGTIHNPHYYQWQNAQTGEAPPRNPQDVLCGGLIAYHTLHYHMIKGMDATPVVRSLTSLHRSVSHITNVNLRDMRTLVRTLGDHEENRINYILKKISKEELEKCIFNKDHQLRKNMELLHIYELLSVVGIELFASLHQYRTVEIKKILDKIENDMQCKKATDKKLILEKTEQHNISEEERAQILSHVELFWTHQLNKIKNGQPFQNPKNRAIMGCTQDELDSLKFTSCQNELFISWKTLFYDEIRDQLEKYDRLRIYCNSQLETISVSYNHKVPQIDEGYDIVNKKFSLAKAKKATKISEEDKNVVLGPNKFAPSGEGSSSSVQV